MTRRVICIWGHTKQIKGTTPAPEKCPAVRRGYACLASVVKVERRDASGFWQTESRPIAFRNAWDIKEARTA